MFLPASWGLRAGFVHVAPSVLRFPGSSQAPPATHVFWEGGSGRTEDKKDCPHEPEVGSHPAQPPHPLQPLIWARGPCQGSVASADPVNSGCRESGTWDSQALPLPHGPVPSWWASWSVSQGRWQGGGSQGSGGLQGRRGRPRGGQSSVSLVSLPEPEVKGHLQTVLHPSPGPAPPPPPRSGCCH